MLFYKLFNCLNICVTICVIINGEQLSSNIEEKENGYEMQLIYLVYEYSKNLQPLIGQCEKSSQHKDFVNGLISEQVMECFGSEILLIIKLMYINYLSKFPMENSDSSLKAYKSENKYKITVLSTFEMEICSYIIQFADFIYICANTKLSLTFEIGKYHLLLCNTFPELVAQICIRDKDNTNYLCPIDNFNVLQNKIGSLKNSNDDFIEQNYKDLIKGTYVFIINVRKCLINIDKTRMMMNNRLPTNDNVFRTINNEYRDIEFDLINLHNRQNKQHKLVNRFTELNNNYINSITLIKCNLPSELLTIKQDEYAKPITVTKLLLHALKSLGNFFQLNMLQFVRELIITDELFINYDLINVWMSNTFNRICKYIPLILLYLSENKNIDTVLFGMYFTFCDDIMGFVCRHCLGVQISMNGKVRHNINCIVEAIKDKLLWNLYTINPKPEVNKLINGICSDSHFKYISDVYEILIEYYDMISLDLWSTFDWMSGKHFLTRKYYSNDKIAKLKDTVIPVNEVDMTLLEAYYLILPLNSNLSTLLAFQNIIVHYLNQEYNYYVYRHALVLLAYLKYINYITEDIIINIKNSWNWYLETSKLFYKYLSLPIWKKPENNIIIIISVLNENLNNANVKKLMEIIPGEYLNDIMSWLDSVIKGPKKQTVKGLNKLVMENCIDAIEYFNAFISIAQESLSSNEIINNHNNSNVNNNNNINGNTENVYLKYCTASLSNIFVEKTHHSKLMSRLIYIFKCLKRKYLCDHQ